MRIALFGYGKMGKVIEKIAQNRGHEITARVDSSNPKERFDLSDTDVVIEFSKPEFAEENIRFCINNNLPIVIGTTGWYDKLEDLTSYCNTNSGAMLHATNFSLGVNIFFEINKKLAAIMSNFPDYETSVVEIHHTEKLDAPSGTGITIAEGIIEQHQQFDGWENVKKTEITDKKTLSIESQRLPNVPGTHEVIYESSIDKIELIHTAHNREGFGLGSILAAEWLKGKQGVYTMKDVLNF
ncbi:4-hydroxy-tetrahydrodipicolinate reductase [Paracrocinitomix mangrovi]|uniref:4-hydroxy-tetrahydrodipicolinate reductase n=1 Tax=Paracrocinitomix mangrovi TaxID=2862509 RepID=UPI001C8EA7FD|nr:4-hydroxy-tetrahydrodipicolinate reductase [Paracrocinitomix mangrovi]UKN01634.1 4-hydroxy-tetrahydrodipicolinate reductase [Paracrocinitomix mangrovi]